MLRPVLLVCAAGALSLAGCAAAPGDQSTDEPTDQPTTTELVPASELVGLWRVDAEGVAEDTWVQIGSPFSATDVTVWRECGYLSGSWLARGGALLASVNSWSDSCTEADKALWLTDATGYGVDGDGMVLLDAAGAELATLTIDGEPAANPNITDEYRQQPELSEQDAAALDSEPAALPEGLEPAAREELLDTWVPTQAYPTEPFLELLDDGTWTGSDGCNGLGGRWALAGDGSVLALSGAQTLIGCEGENLGNSLGQAAWLVVDGDTLTFYDAAAEEIGQASRG